MSRQDLKPVLSEKNQIAIQGLMDNFLSDFRKEFSSLEEAVEGIVVDFSQFQGQVEFSLTSFFEKLQETLKSLEVLKRKQTFTELERQNPDEPVKDGIYVRIQLKMKSFTNNLLNKITDFQDDLVKLLEEENFDAQKAVDDLSQFQNEAGALLNSFYEKLKETLKNLEALQNPKPLKEKRQVRFAKDLEEVQFFDAQDPQRLRQFTDQPPAVNLDEFNRVARNVNMTQQNIDFLLRISLEKYYPSKSEEEIDELIRTQFSMAYLPFDAKDESLDYSLRDAVLNFLGQDPQQKKATILVGLSEINQQNVLEARNGHWFCLHLIREPNGILVSNLDSLGGPVRSSIDRIFAKIPQIQVKDLTEKDGTLSDLNQRILSQIPNVRFEIENQYCERQEGVDCGYHAVFNALVVHFDYEFCDIEGYKISQDGREMTVEKFILQRIKDLQKMFGSQEEIGFQEEVKKEELDEEELDFLEQVQSLEIPELLKSIIIHSFSFKENKKDQSSDFLEFFQSVENIEVLQELLKEDFFISVESVFLLLKLKEGFSDIIKKVDDEAQRNELTLNYSKLDIDNSLKDFVMKSVEYIRKNVEDFPIDLSQEKLDFVLGNLSNPEIFDRLTKDDFGYKFINFLEEMSQENLDELYSQIKSITQEQSFELTRENLAILEDLARLEGIAERFGDVGRDFAVGSASFADSEKMKQDFREMFGKDLDSSSETSGTLSHHDFSSLNSSQETVEEVVDNEEEKVVNPVPENVVVTEFKRVLEQLVQQTKKGRE